MSLKVLFIANAVMMLFVAFVLVQSFVGMNASGVMGQMHESGLVERTSVEKSG